MIQAPKIFRRAADIKLERVEMPNAQETLWNCNDITLKQVNAVGDYFAMNSENIRIEHFTLSGNYAFDGAKNIEVSHAKLLSKDAFWNCENVVVRDSTIIGEYLAGIEKYYLHRLHHREQPRHVLYGEREDEELHDH